MWTCADDRHDIGTRYRWVITDRAAYVLAKHKKTGPRKYLLPASLHDFTKLMEAIVLNPNSIIPDFKD